MTTRNKPAIYKKMCQRLIKAAIMANRQVETGILLTICESAGVSRKTGERAIAALLRENIITRREIGLYTLTSRA